MEWRIYDGAAKEITDAAKSLFTKDSVIALYSRRGELFNRWVKLDRDKAYFMDTSFTKTTNEKLKNSCGGFEGKALEINGKISLPVGSWPILNLVY